jgi:hypothetical protein
MNLIKGIALDVQKLNPNVKNIVNKQSPFIHKTTLIDYHPVGHSKREKVIHYII